MNSVATILARAEAAWFELLAVQIAHERVCEACHAPIGTSVCGHDEVAA